MKSCPNSSIWKDLQHDFLQSILKTLSLDPNELEHCLKLKNHFDTSTLALFSGFVSVADWIASNENLFPYCTDSNLSSEKYLEYARAQAQHAVNTIGWSGWKAPSKSPTFGDLFPEIGPVANPRPIQKWAQSASPDLRFAIIEAPMGEGKTEAALILLERLIIANELRGGYFALPTMATSNQMLVRVDSFLRNWIPGIRINLHLLHGKALFSEAYQSLQLRAVGQDVNDDNVIADEWFQRPKRGLLSPFAVGTVDQSLLASLKTRHFFVRLFGLAGKVLIFDEVHAYDTYMLTLFENLLAWLSRLGTRIIILSATLPASTREKLFRAYAGNTEFTLPEASYPRITTLDKNNRIQATSYASTLSPKYHIEWRKDDIAQRAGELENLLEAGGKALWICNTVRKTQEVYGELKKRFSDKEIEISLFHARYPLKKRLEIEKKVLHDFGKDPNLSKKAHILVATQVVEQSLDLDFDLMISEVAPIDLILQRIGRLHRHYRPRPKKLKDPLLILLEPEMDANNLPYLKKSVYDEYILLRSWRRLRDSKSISLPSDMDQLIESVYGEETRSGMDTLFSDKLDEALAISNKRKIEQKRKGDKAVIPEPSKNKALEHLDVELDEDNTDAHPMIQARTRLSGPSVNIVCLHKVNGITCLDTEGNRPVDFTRPPKTFEEIRSLMGNSASLSFPSVLKLFPEDLIPPAWRKSSMLRHHRLVVFDDGQFHTASGKMTLFLNSEKGLVSQWKGEDENGSDLQSDQ